jgi:hypothetical protein
VADDCGSESSPATPGEAGAPPQPSPIEIARLLACRSFPYCRERRLECPRSFAAASSIKSLFRLAVINSASFNCASACFGFSSTASRRAPTAPAKFEVPDMQGPIRYLRLGILGHRLGRAPEFRRRIALLRHQPVPTYQKPCLFLRRARAGKPSHGNEWRAGNSPNLYVALA